MAKQKFLIPNDIKDLQIFAEAQFETILDLNLKIEKLENENKRLKQIAIVPQSLSPLSHIMVSDEQSICQMELKRLQEKALNGPLSFEDTKKVQVFTELLLKMENKPKTFNIMKDKTDAELLAIANDDSTN